MALQTLCAAIIAGVACAAAKQPNACQISLDCELNGDCVNGACVCDPAWRGKNCEFLALQPAPVQNGYRVDGTSSWGGTTLLGDDQKYHMFVGEFINNCGLNSWYRNEAVVHAVADNPTGPYRRVNSVKGAVATCPHAVRSPERLWLIFHTACGNSTAAQAPIQGCANGTTPPQPPPPPAQPTPSPFLPTPVPAPPIMRTPTCNGGSTSVFYSHSPDGPWLSKAVLSPPTNGVFPFGISNPTPYIFPNGTTLLLFRSYSNKLKGKTWNIHSGAYPGYTLIGMATAPHWAGPYTVSPEPIFANMNEDPFLYRTKRGFHAVFHGMDLWPGKDNVGRHAFSLDGVRWIYSRANAWSTTVEYTDGKSVEYARRERPEFVFDANGHIVALTSGVVDPDVVTGQADRSFTVVQPVASAGGGKGGALAAGALRGGPSRGGGGGV